MDNKLYRKRNYGEYILSDVFETVRASGGDVGGGTETLIMYSTPPQSARCVPETTKASGRNTSKTGSSLSRCEPMIDTLVFDEGQITNPTQGSHPKWGGCCHSLTGNAGRTVVIIEEREDKQMPDTVIINGTKYTKEDGAELVKLAHEFLDGNDSPEAKKLMETVKANMSKLFGDGQDV